MTEQNQQSEKRLPTPEDVVHNMGDEAGPVETSERRPPDQIRREADAYDHLFTDWAAI